MASLEMPPTSVRGLSILIRDTEVRRVEDEVLAVGENKLDNLETS